MCSTQQLENWNINTEFELCLRTVSESNVSEHWTTKHKRHKFQQFIVKDALKSRGHRPQWPMLIRLIRYAPKKLDKHDNLPMAFKWILDAICDYCSPGKAAGRADDNEGLIVFYDQVTSKKYKVSIEIYKMKSPSFEGTDKP